MHSDVRRVHNRAGGGVGLGDTDKEARRIDAGLGCETHEATCAFVAGAGRGDVHGVVEGVDEVADVHVRHGPDPGTSTWGELPRHQSYAAPHARRRGRADPRAGELRNLRALLARPADAGLRWI